MLHNKKNLLFFIFQGLLLSQSALAQTLDASLNDDTVSAEIIGQSYQRPELSLSLGFFHHRNNGEMANAGFYLTEVPGHKSSQRPDISIGAKLLAFDINDGGPEGSALAFGGKITLPLLQPDFSVQAIGFYAPRVTAFEDSDSYFEGALRLVFHLISPADLFVGYRKISIGLEDEPGFNLENDVYAGAVLRF